MVALGFLAFLKLTQRRARKASVDSGAIQNVALTALIFGILGGRLGYVLLHWEFFRENLVEIIRIDHGGLVFYGGFALGLAAALLSMRVQRLPILKTTDLFVPSLVLAHAIGRIGCFLNGCCYGIETRLPWGVAFPHENISRHPTQLYEGAALVVIFAVLIRLARYNPKPGSILLTYGTLYGAWRYGVEFLRGDTPVVAWNLTTFQWLSIPLVLICAGVLLVRRFTSR